jgi:multifunctional 2-oxoglutarate metabolism enzyme
VAAAEEKWRQRSSLVLLLPHGYEGQGPEHSSARLERFLQLCAEDNMIVCNFTTPANYFHALRRQVLRPVKKPLVIMAPKSLLRHPMVVSTPDDLMHGSVQRLIPAAADPADVERLIFCSGKVYYDLVEAMRQDEAMRRRIAVARLEQFYPFHGAVVSAELKRFSHVRDVLWVQEEPANMGAWSFIQNRFDRLMEEVHHDCCTGIRYVGRPASASTAAGSAKIHQVVQQRILEEALTLDGS